MAARALVGSSAMLYALYDWGSWCRCTGQNAFDRQIFIELRPMDAEATAGEFPAVSLIERSVKQSRIPGERDAYATTVSQIDNQMIFVEAYTRDRHSRARC